MIYFLSNAHTPLEYVSSGKLINQEHFIHKKRDNLDTFVLLVGIKGELYIAQNDHYFTLKENQFILLLEGTEHFGWKQSPGLVSYYWCHFKLREPHRLLSEKEVSQYLFLMQNDAEHADVFLIPEFGELRNSNRIRLYFRQLLDLARQNCYSHYLTDYPLSSMMMEVSQEFLTAYHKHAANHINYNIVEIMEWIRINYQLPLTVSEIARTFNYNPNYLTTIFKEETGFSLLKYIQTTRIAAAKKLLLESSLTIKEIADQVGFADEKSFMKLFKKREDVTPTQYRHAFFRTKLNKE